MSGQSSKVVLAVNRQGPTGGAKRKFGVDENRLGAKKVDTRTREQKAADSAAHKAARKQEAIENALYNLQNWVRNPQGTDVPGGGVLRKWNKSRPVYLVCTQQPTVEVPHPEQKTTIVKVMAHRDLSTMAPGLQVWKEGVHWSFRSQNFKPGSNPNVPTLSYATMASNASTEEYMAHFEEHYLKDWQVNDLKKFGHYKHGEDKIIGSLILTRFSTRGEFWVEKKPRKSKQTVVGNFLVDFVDKLNSGTYKVTLVHQERNVNAEIERHWADIIHKCAHEGVYNFFNKNWGSRQIGTLFNDWKSDPTLPIDLPKWLEDSSIQAQMSPIKRYGTIRDNKTYGSPSELEIVMSLGVICEVLYEKALAEYFFDFDVTHKGEVIDVKRDMIQLAIIVDKSNDFVMPAVEAGTVFEVRRMPLDNSSNGPTTQASLGDYIFDPSEDINTLPPAREPSDYDGVRFRGRVLDVPNEADFVVSVKIDDPVERPNYQLGRKMGIALKMTPNTLPAQRQLRAIGRICGATGGKNTYRTHVMQRLLMGKGNPPVDPNLPKMAADAFTRMQPNEQELFLDFAESLGMETAQLAFWDAVFYERDSCVMLQGPPGTGKTHIGSAAAVAMCVLKMRTAYCAPSNVAAEAALRNIVSWRKQLQALDKEGTQGWGVVYMPTQATLKWELRNLGQLDPEAASNDMIDEGERGNTDEFKQYKLYNWIVKSFQRRLETSPTDKEARIWLDSRDKLLRGERIGIKNHKAFFELANKEIPRVLKSMDVRLVVSICNSAEMMHQAQYNPEAVYVDEAGSNTEPDVYIPLSLKARFNILIGDHEQLKPVVKSRGYNICAGRLAMSAFERFFAHSNVPVIRLKMNHRMHKDIAQISGRLTYKVLLSAPSTEIISPEYAYIENWWNSQSAWNDFGRWKQPPAFGSPQKASIRTLWFNVENAYASPRGKTKSLVNYGNINVICNLLNSIFWHDVGNSGLDELPGSSILIMSPYKEQAKELRLQVRWTLQGPQPHFTNIPEVATVDRMQGGERRIVIFDFTPDQANTLGFLKLWNRLNVGFSRSKDILWIVGNLTRLRQELHLICEIFKCRKLALSLIHFLEHGLVVNCSTNDYLPKDINEGLGSLNNWSKKQPPADHESNAYTEPQIRLNQKYADPQAKLEYEGKLVDEYRLLHREASLLDSRYLAGDRLEDLDFVDDSEKAKFDKKQSADDSAFEDDDVIEEDENHQLEEVPADEPDPEKETAGGEEAKVDDETMEEHPPGPAPQGSAPQDPAPVPAPGKNKVQHILTEAELAKREAGAAKQKALEEEFDVDMSHLLDSDPEQVSVDYHPCANNANSVQNDDNQMVEEDGDRHLPHRSKDKGKSKDMSPGAQNGSPLAESASGPAPDPMDDEADEQLQKDMQKAKAASLQDTANSGASTSSTSASSAASAPPAAPANNQQHGGPHRGGQQDRGGNGRNFGHGVFGSFGFNGNPNFNAFGRNFYGNRDQRGRGNGEGGKKLWEQNWRGGQGRGGGTGGGAN